MRVGGKRGWGKGAINAHHTQHSKLLAKGGESNQRGGSGTPSLPSRVSTFRAARLQMAIRKIRDCESQTDRIMISCSDMSQQSTNLNCFGTNLICWIICIGRRRTSSRSSGASCTASQIFPLREIEWKNPQGRTCRVVRAGLL
jgi:hypothetical protein